MIVAYADASLKDNLLGIGYVIERYNPIEDEQRTLLEASHTLLNTDEIEGRVTSMEAEYRACITAARRATDYGDECLMLNTDSVAVVNKVDNDETISENGYYRHALLSFVERFDNWELMWTSRDNNDLAHNEARMAMKIGEYYGGATA